MLPDKSLAICRYFKLLLLFGRPLSLVVAIM
jgi:hypothetical protein